VTVVPQPSRKEILWFEEYCRAYTVYTVKDIVQPKKRGVKRGMNRFVSTSYTIADVFFEHLKG
jgi:hypothetical protein